MPFKLVRLIPSLESPKSNCLKELIMYKTACILLALGVLGCTEIVGPSSQAAESSKAAAEPLYRQDGTDPSFAALMERKAFPVGKNSKGGVTGSAIDIDDAQLANVPTADNPIPKDIAIHTLCSSYIPREDFAKWTRWYQEDGNTQVFRLFKGEHNVRNDRANSARIEAFGGPRFARGDWHEWEGTYTIVKPTAVRSSNRRTTRTTGR
jgi:hypothetical protein